jgi:hypothetical protein
MDPSFWDMRRPSLQPRLQRVQWPTLATYSIDSSHQTTVTDYIYCIKLPHFECKPQSTSTSTQVQQSRQADRQARRPAPYPSSPPPNQQCCSINS